MKLHFKPMPWLTVIVAICLAILISLGTWQYQRLQWKTALLADVEVAANAPPFKSFTDVQAALDKNEPVDFRRIQAKALGLLGDTGGYFVFTPENRDISWRVFFPVTTDAGKVFIAGPIVPDNQRDQYNFSANWDFDVAVAGYVRLARKRERGMTKSSPDKNRWFGFNPMPETHDWADMAGIEADMRFYVDTVPGATEADLLPARRPEIRNNHFDYMLTWYSFALILLIIYFILHRRAGCLRFS